MEGQAMQRVNRLMNNQIFQDYLQKIQTLEKDRIFCRHDLEHALTVARIAYAYLSDQADPEQKVEREIVYAAALLHDIGRFIEYESGEDHAAAGARLAWPLLKEAGFGEEEAALILKAILQHRLPAEKASTPLGKALALADDWGRLCLTCAEQSRCHKFSPGMLEIRY